MTVQVRRSVNGLRGVLAAGAALVLLSGCGLMGGDDAEGGSSDGVVPSVDLADDGTVSDSVASVTRPFEDYEVNVDVLRLQRFEKATRLEFAVTPRSRGGDDALDRNFFSSNGYSNQADGVYLLDTANLKQYPVLRVDEDTCACSELSEGFPLDQATVLFADFPVAPEDVENLTVVFPRTGPVGGVPVTS